MPLADKIMLRKRFLIETVLDTLNGAVRGVVGIEGGVVSGI